MVFWCNLIGLLAGEWATSVTLRWQLIHHHWNPFLCNGMFETDMKWWWKSRVHVVHIDIDQMHERTGGDGHGWTRKQLILCNSASACTFRVVCVHVIKWFLSGVSPYRVLCLPFTPKHCMSLMLDVVYTSNDRCVREPLRVVPRNFITGSYINCMCRDNVCN